MIASISEAQAIATTIDVTKLTRDYIKNPLEQRKNQKTEVICKEDLKYLYVDAGITKATISGYLRVSPNLLYKWIKLYDLQLDRNTIAVKSLNTKLRRYGSKSYNNIAKIAATNKANHGGKWNTQHKEHRIQSAITYKEKTGYDHNMHNPESIRKLKNTKKLKYGDENYTNSAKARQTNLQRYGYETTFERPEVQEKSKMTNLTRYGVEHTNSLQWKKDKIRNTMLERYGVTTYTKSAEYLEKMHKTNRDKFGFDNVSQSHIPMEYVTIFNDPEKLRAFILDMPVKTIPLIARELHYDVTGVYKQVYKFGLESLITWHESSGELEIDALFPQMFKKARGILDNMEIDLYNEELKFGIEFNGDYWHSDHVLKPHPGKDTKLYHQRKSLLAEEKGIFLYHIFEYEWIDESKRKRIINHINNILGRNTNRIFARKCNIKEVSNQDSRNFLDTNHIQGARNSKIRLGLYYNDELVSLMTFNSPSVNSKNNYEWELSRFCSLANYNVTGGASKLFKHFIKTYNPKSIISYSDIAKTRGRLYETLGFEFSHISNPLYCWTHRKDVLSRQQCMKKHLIRRGFDGNKTEDEIMYSLHYNKIYDCGKKVWIWKILGRGGRQWIF
jgi:hypothetical protein